MSNTLAQVVRPNAEESVTPTPFTKPGSGSHPLVRVSVGLKGGTKTFTTSYSNTTSSLMGKVHKENSPKSEAVQRAMQQATVG